MMRRNVLPLNVWIRTISQIPVALLSPVTDFKTAVPCQTVTVTLFLSLAKTRKTPTTHDNAIKLFIGNIVFANRLLLLLL